MGAVAPLPSNFQNWGRVGRRQAGPYLKHHSGGLKQIVEHRGAYRDSPVGKRQGRHAQGHFPGAEAKGSIPAPKRNNPWQVSLCPLGLRHSLLQAEAELLTKAAGIGIENGLGMAKAAEHGQYVLQLYEG